MGRDRSRSPDRKHRSRSRERKKSRSPDRKSRKRSRSKSRERKRSPGKDRERKSRSRSRERRRDRSPDRKHKKHRSRSGERSRRDKDKEHGSSRRHVKVDDGEEEEGAGGVAPSTSNAKKSEPISLEELLKKRQEQAAAQAKPVFMTKAQREAAALAAREEQVKAQRAGLEKLRQEAQQRGVKELENERKQREQARQARLDEREREKELEGIKLQYLGEKKQKKRIVRPSEKFRFNFDWENSEDTSKDLNPLYNNPHEAALLFGRGLRAGMDRKEQKKQAATHENELRAHMKKSSGVEITREDRDRERKAVKAAEKYEDSMMKKDQHWSGKNREDMTERDWRIFKEDFNISVKGGKIPNPIRNWEEASMPKQLMKAVDKAGYKKPSPIQMAAIPLGMAQRDVIGVAETGSGKTCAFVLPMLVYCMKLPPMTEEIEAEGPYAVVMAPTRELAQQIEEETVKFAYYLDYRVVSVVGGQSIEEQGFKLRRGCELVIATPGRLLDCLQNRYTVLNQCNYIVLDEADRMIDLGFEPQVMGVMDAMPSSHLKPVSEEEDLDTNKIYRTTYMFSATMPPAVERLARKYMRNPAVINIGNAGKSADLIRQDVFMMKENEKIHRLEELISREIFGDRTGIVFVNAKKQCDYVAKQLENMNVSATVLHGGKTQEQREASLEGFKTGKYNILVATDVAGRGIDVPDVAHVINFAMPTVIDQYTHRIGRTGRAGKTGVATTFITESDHEIFFDLKNYLTQAKAAIPHELARHESSKVKPGGGFGDKKKRRQDEIIFQ